MTKRRKFTPEFKAKVALEALRGDKAIQEIAARHKLHPNQVSTWKRQAMDGLGEVFSKAADQARPLHGQHIHRAAVALAQVRSGPPARADRRLPR
jgi:transposase